MNFKTTPILLAFLCMGFVDGVGAFVGLAKEEYGLTMTKAQLLSVMVFIMFGALSIPMGLVQDRSRKKTILLVGLAIELAGVALTVVGTFLAHPPYELLLATMFFVGAGAAVLQVAGNPIMRDVSSAEEYPRNLSTAQFIKAIGSLSGPVIPPIVVQVFGLGWKTLFPLYAVVLLATIAMVAFTPIDERKAPAAKPATFASCLALLGNPYIFTMVLAIFIYIGVEVCISTNVATYLEKAFAIRLATWGTLGNALFIFSILAGRFLGSIMLNWVSAKKFLVFTVLLTIAALGGLLLARNPATAIACIVASGLGCANVFPLVFSLAVNSMPERTNEISGLMVTAIVGGAFIPLLMAYVADRSTATWAFLVPLVGATYLLYAAIVSLRPQPAVIKS